MSLLELITTLCVVVLFSIVWIIISPFLGIGGNDNLSNMVTRTIVKTLAPKKYHSIKNANQDFITVHVFRVSYWSLNLEDYQGGYYETTSGRFRRVSPRDNHCCICKKFIQNMMRRILHDTDSECYVCYRKRVMQEDLEVFLLLSEISFQEVSLDLQRLIYWDFYRNLRIEKLRVTPAPGLETSLVIPDFHYLLMHFPELRMPEWIDNKMVWGYNFHDGSYNKDRTFDMNLWLRILPRRKHSAAWQRLSNELNAIMKWGGSY